MMRRVILGICSSLWVAPLGMAAHEVRAFVEGEWLYRVGGQPRLDSFPHLDFAEKLLYVALAWLALVVTGWAIFLLNRLKAGGIRPTD